MLITHSVTLKDEAAARAECLRAREILLRAKQLGEAIAGCWRIYWTIRLQMVQPGIPEVLKWCRR